MRAPATVGYMLTGMRLAMGNCFSTIIAAELLAPKDGLGYLIFSSRTWMQTEFASPCQIMFITGILTSMGRRW